MMFTQSSLTVIPVAVVDVPVGVEVGAVASPLPAGGSSLPHDTNANAMNGRRRTIGG